MKSSEEERGKWGRSKSESLYPTRMINVQEYASEALVQRGWHLAEFSLHMLMNEGKDQMHKEQQTGSQG